MITATKQRDAARETELANIGMRAEVEWSDNQKLVVTVDLREFDRFVGDIESVLSGPWR